RKDGLAAARSLNLLQFALRVLELLFERLFLGTEFSLGVPPQSLNQRKRPLFHAASAQRDQRVASRKVLKCAQDESAVMGDRHRDVLTTDVLAGNPEPVGENI